MTDPIHGPGQPGDSRFERPILDGHPAYVPDAASAKIAADTPVFPQPEGPTEIIETPYEIGQDNVSHALTLEFDIHKVVFIVSAAVIALFTVGTLIGQILTAQPPIDGVAQPSGLELAFTALRDGLTGKLEITDSALSIQSVPGDRLALVVAPGHVWANRPPTRAADLKSSPWVLREIGSGTRAVCENVFAQRGLGIGEIDVAFELPSNEAVRVAVESGAGATIMSMLVVAQSIDAGRLVAVAFDIAPRQFHVLRHKERHLSVAEQRFLELVQ